MDIESFVLVTTEEALKRIDRAGPLGADLPTQRRHQNPLKLLAPYAKWDLFYEQIDEWANGIDAAHRRIS